MRTDLPSGTVTFLFSDVEGSTQQVRRSGEEYPSVLATQRGILRAIFDKFHGHEVNTQGDSLLAVFARAADAIAASVMAQRALAEHTSVASESARVRMGLHTGSPQLTAAGYVGPDAHIAAHLCVAAHGGQILLSQPTRDLVQQLLLEDVRLRDLGEHRLKDLEQPHHIFQLVISELPDEFPPLRSLDALPHNLPIQLTSFVGREREIAEIKRLLTTTRLLTLTGAGGSGKTRLALQVAAEEIEFYADGVWLIELTPLAEPALVPQAIAAVLGVREQPGQPLLNSLVDYVRPKNMLLMLDNCEHLIDSCARVSDSLLRACPDLRILATSREALGIAGETAWVVPSLSLPDARQPRPTFADLSQYEAVQLFIDRAVAVQPSFKLTELNALAVAQVCQRLGGIPLAIELAAARVKILKTAEIAARLDDRFTLLTAGSRTALPRHQTLRAAIDWSYDLLTEPERVLLRRLSVFAGGCTLEAAEAVCKDEGRSARMKDEKSTVFILHPSSFILDVLSHLVDKSLVLVDKQASQTRYRMLETIQQYAWEKLREAEELDMLRTRHRIYFFQLVADVGAPNNTREESDWLDRAEAEYANVRAALEWAILSGATRDALQAAVGLWGLWNPRGWNSEGAQWLSRILAVYHDEDPVKVAGLTEASRLARMLDETTQMRAYLEQGRALAERLGDTQAMGRLLIESATYEVERENYSAALALLEQVLPLRRWEELDWEPILTLYWMGHAQLRLGNLAESRRCWQEGLEQARRAEDQFDIGWGLGGLSMQARYEGDLNQATVLSRESLVVKWQYQDRPGIAFSLEELAMIATDEGKVQRAVRLWGAAERYRETIHAVVPPMSRTEYDRHIARARAEMDTAEFERAWGEGRAMSIEQAIEYALEPTPSRELEVETGTSRRAAKQEFGGLTTREREVAMLVARGKSNRDIAAELVLSERTVETHVTNILNKLGFTSRAQIRKWALEKGLVTRDK